MCLCAFNMYICILGVLTHMYIETVIHMYCTKKKLRKQNCKRVCERKYENVKKRKCEKTCENESENCKYVTTMNEIIGRCEQKASGDALTSASPTTKTTNTSRRQWLRTLFICTFTVQCLKDNAFDNTTKAEQQNQSETILS